MHQLVSFVAVRLAVTSALSNCDGSSPIDVRRTDEILRSILNAWREGRRPDDPDGAADYVVEPRWNDGYRLERFEIGLDLTPVDLDVSCPVELWMRSPAGKAVHENVRYVVSTSPRRVVVRSPS